MNKLIAAAAFLIALVPATSKLYAQGEPRRLALSVGVGAYKSMPALSSPPNDARDVGKYLKGTSRFQDKDVIVLGDDKTQKSATKAAILAAWSKVLEGLASIEGSGDGSVVLFYFSGHGVEINGKNYLLASDEPDGFKGATISLDELFHPLAWFQTRHPDLVAIFIIDACRDGIVAPPGGQGVASTHAHVTDPPKQVFVWYATSIGQTARDGANDGYSMFTKSLIDALKIAPADAMKADEISIGRFADHVRFKVTVASSALNPDAVQVPATYLQFDRARSLFGKPLDEGVASVGAGAAFKDVLPPNVMLGLKHKQSVLECNGCPELVVIDPQPFKMGAAGAPGGQIDVAIKSRLAIGKYEITKEQWNYCVDDQDPAMADKKCLPATRQDVNGRSNPEARDADSKKPYADPKKLREPAESISWHDAKRYAAWLSAKVTQAHVAAGRQAAVVYRLPSEAEWEFAARGGGTGDYAFDPAAKGERTSGQCLAANGADRSLSTVGLSNVAPCVDGYGRIVSPVGRFKPNAWLLHDMFGNVREWVEDCYVERHAGNPGDGSARVDGGCARRSARGGSWASGPDALKSHARNAFPPGLTHRTLGLRLVRELP